MPAKFAFLPFSKASTNQFDIFQQWHCRYCDYSAMYKCLKPLWCPLGEILITLDIKQKVINYLDIKIVQIK